MRSTAIGLDIGACGVRAAQLSFGGDGVELHRFAHVPLPDGAVREGEVIDGAAVTAALRELWSSTRFCSKKVVLGVSNRGVIVRQVDVPAVPLAEIAQALPFQVQDLLPMPVESAVLDFHPLDEFAGVGGQRMLRGLLVAAARDMVTRTVRCVEEAGLTPTTVDLTPFALLRSVGRRLDADVRAEAVVDIGAHVTNVVVHTAGVPRFVRVLLRGGQDVTDAVADHLGLPPDEAELLKHRVVLQAAPDPTDTAPVAVADGAQALLDELRGSLDYFQSANPGEPVERVVLSGGGSLLQGFAEQLATATGVPVVPGDPLATMRVRGSAAGDELLEDPALVAVPVGLALGAQR